MGFKKVYRPILGYDGAVIDGGGDAGVESVNGQTGAVTLAAADVGALPDTYTPPAAPVQSVNGQTGAVTLTAANVGAATAAQGALAASAVQPADLAEVATSGAYGDLSGTPTIPSTPGDVGAATAAQGALAASAVQPGDLSSVATSGAYGDLSGTPTIPVISFATISAIEGDWRGEGVETLGAALLALQGA